MMKSDSAASWRTGTGEGRAPSGAVSQVRDSKGVGLRAVSGLTADFPCRHSMVKCWLILNH